MLGAYLLIILAVVLDLVPREQATVVSIGATALLLVVCRLTGGKPGGGWGI